MSDYGKAEIHQRYFYHLDYQDETLSGWSHAETDPGDGHHQPIWFELFWVNLPEAVPALIADHDYFLTILIAKMKLR